MFLKIIRRKGLIFLFKLKPYYYYYLGAIPSTHTIWVETPANMTLSVATIPKNMFLGIFFVNNKKKGVKDI